MQYLTCLLSKRISWIEGEVLAIEKHYAKAIRTGPLRLHKPANMQNYKLLLKARISRVAEKEKFKNFK